MSSAKHTEKALYMCEWVQSELYQYLLNNPIETKQIGDDKNLIALSKLIVRFMDEVPIRHYDNDYRHDWTITPFMSCLRGAYKEAVLVLSRRY
jgi:hypothetical protein